MKFYSVRDPLNKEERQRLGVKDYYAVWTGEHRPPKKGEWFLSGAVVEAYRAAYDLESAYPIARLVKTRVETITSIVRV